MKTSVRLDEVLALKRTMLVMGRQAQQEMPSLEVAGVLISLYRDTELEIERRALSYALVVLLMQTSHSRM